MFYDLSLVEATIKKLETNIVQMEQEIDEYIEYCLFNNCLDENKISITTTMLEEMYEQFENLAAIRFSILN
jgi:hypothetical protein